MANKVKLTKQDKMLFKEMETKWQEEIEKRQKLLSKSMDFDFLQEIVMKCNRNPDLRVRITLHDGTHIDIGTYRSSNTSNKGYEDYIEI